MIHENAVVVDAVSNSHVTREQFERFRTGGVTAVNHAAIDHGLNLENLLVALVRLIRDIEALPDCYVLIRSVDDIRRAKQQHRVGVIVGLQDGNAVGDRVEHLRVLHDLGVRVIQLTYNDRNLIGDGCLEPADGGLSAFGRAAVREMNRLGIVIDLSHCGLRTTREAIDHSERPVVITHANPSALSPSPRNKPDEILRAVAARGGVFGLTTFSPLVARTRERAPTIEDFVDLIEYVVNLIGLDAVCVGTDHTDGVFDRDDFEKRWGWQAPLYRDLSPFMGPWYTFDTKNVVGLESAADWGNLTEGLLRRRYGDNDVRKILGGNLLRVLSDVWR
jgi:membrane dipeptidase